MSELQRNQWVGIATPGLWGEGMSILVPRLNRAQRARLALRRQADAEQDADQAAAPPAPALAPADGDRYTASCGVMLLRPELPLPGAAGRYHGRRFAPADAAAGWNDAALPAIPVDTGPPPAAVTRAVRAEVSGMPASRLVVPAALLLSGPATAPATRARTREPRGPRDRPAAG